MGQDQSDYPSLGFLIGGEWLMAAGVGRQDVINPATEEVLGEVPLAGATELDAALQAAAGAFPAWRRITALRRATLLHEVAAIIRRRSDKIARILTLEQGKILRDAEAEVAGAAAHFDWMAEEGRRAYGRLIPSREPDVRYSAVPEPVGVVAAFTPWNFPATSPARKLSTALAAGCTIIIKPSEETPATCLELVRACHDAGIPPGVVNLVFGNPDEVSRHLLASPIVRKVSFTGSVRVGKLLARMASENLQRCTLELGGHSPVVVCDDVDVAAVAETLVRGKFRNSGQVCVAPTRFFVQERVIERFVDHFVGLSRTLKLGSGLDADTDLGPLANERRIVAMEQMVADAVKRGGRVATGGEREGNRGYFWPPTPLLDVPDDALVMREEPFGPLAPIVSFRDDDEVVARANNVPYGLAGYVFTNSARRSAMLADQLQTGMVAVNGLTVSTPESPIGGVKDSGYGREGGAEGILEYTNIKFRSEALL